MITFHIRAASWAFAVSLAVIACGGSEKKNPSEPTTDKSDPAKAEPEVEATALAPESEPPEAACDGVADAKELRLIATSVPGQTDLRLDLETGKLTGRQPEKRGEDYISVSVDQQVPTAELHPLKEKLAGLCAQEKTAEQAQHHAPGGGSVFAVTDVSGQERRIVCGEFANDVPEGAKYLELSRTEWDALLELWPSSEPAAD